MAYLTPLRAGLAMFVLCLVVVDAHPLEMLYDFSSPEQLEHWSADNPAADRVEMSSRFATPGSGSLFFHTPRWFDGMGHWPSMKGRFKFRDWTGYERLVIEVVSTASTAMSVQLRITDSKVPYRQGLADNGMIPPLGRLQWVVDLSETNPGETRKIDMSDVLDMHMWIRTPSEDAHLYIDRIYLTEKAEALPPADPALVKQVVALLGDSEGIKNGEALIADVENWLTDARGTDRLWLDAVRHETRERLQSIRDTLSTEGELSEAQRQDLVLRLDHLSRFRGRITSLHDLRQRITPTDGGWGGVIVATASPMQQVLPRDVALPSSIDISQTVDLQLAKNEKEGFQVVVLPLIKPLEQVKVTVDDLRNSDGQALPADAVEVEVVGYVETYLPQHPLANYGQYVGWWPDPLLPFLDRVDVAQGDAQSFFIRLRTTEQTEPGDYAGKVTVDAAEMQQPYTFDLTVRVHDFVLPKRSPLPLAMAFNPDMLKQIAQLVEPSMTDAQWQERWQRQKFEWADFLADHYISYDNIYGSGPDYPDFEVLDHLEATGQLDLINLGQFGTNSAVAFDQIDSIVAKQLPDIKVAYEKAKQRGWLDRSYIYGFDERPKANFPLMEQFVAKMRQALPGVRVMTTAGAYWQYWGEADGIDIWCPIISNWDPSKVARYQAAGQEVWWYICIASPPPFPNVFIDLEVIDSRALMGVMTARFRPDGYLYYAMAGFNRTHRSPLNVNTQYLTSGPFTEWNPKSFAEAHGDGNLIYPGPRGSPLSSLRLENFRDGLEDFAYVTILEQHIAEVKASDRPTPVQQRWLERAESALTVPDRVVKAPNSFTKNPSDIENHRRGLAEALVTLPPSAGSSD